MLIEYNVNTGLILLFLLTLAAVPKSILFEMCCCLVTLAIYISIFLSQFIPALTVAYPCHCVCFSAFRSDSFYKYRHAHPGSPYVFGLVGADHDLDFPEPMPVVGMNKLHSSTSNAFSEFSDMVNLF